MRRIEFPPEKRRVAGLSQTRCYSYPVCNRLCSEAEQFLEVCGLSHVNYDLPTFHGDPQRPNVNGHSATCHVTLQNTWCFPLRSALSAISYFNKLTGAIGSVVAVTRGFIRKKPLHLHQQGIYSNTSGGLKIYQQSILARCAPLLPTILSMDLWRK